MKLYSNHTVPGIIEGPYYWWESGLAWDSMVNYWAVTGDDQYNAMVAEALLFQTGPDNNYMPVNQTKSLGNDDQSFWALAAMTAAETNFPSVAGRNITWLRLAQNVFDTQVARWDPQCEGGIRWQIFSFNLGYNYKNSQTQGNFVQLASRLHRYTGNQTYADWAQKALEWTKRVGLLTTEGRVFDGTDVSLDCSEMNKIQWTATLGAFLNGAAYASNSTTAPATWTALADTLQSGSDVFVKNGVLFEAACAPIKTCNTDQLAFRAVLARAYARTTQLVAPSTARSEILMKSAQGAASACSGGSDGTACGSDWASGSYDGSTGLGQELSALEIILANLPGPTIHDLNTTTLSSVTVGTGSNNTTSTAPAPSTSSNAASRPVVLGGLGALVVFLFML